MAESLKPLGVILCGGKSSRMGKDKSLINYHGISQRDHCKKLLASFCSPVVFSVGNMDALEEESFSDLPIYEGNGPISGLLTLHDYFPTKGIVLLGCDYPLITQSLLQKLIEKTEEDFVANCYTNGPENLAEPLLAYYSASFCHTIKQAFLEDGRSSLRRFLDHEKVHKLSCDHPLHLLSADNPEEESRVHEIIQAGFNTFV